jgi:hypothetical protein
MAKVRLIVFVLTLIIVGLAGTFVSFYARGYRLNFTALFTKGEVKFQPNGILVIKSEPDGASVFIDGELKTATNATVSIAPGTYDVEVKKDGYFSWYKRLVIEKEIVTQAGISLFKNAPSLSPVTFSGAQNPVVSTDGAKIAYTDKTGLWTMDTFTLPLGFSNEPKKITDGDLDGAVYEFSPDGRQLLLTLSNSLFLLDSGAFTSQSQRVNIASQKESILAGWEKEKKAKDQALTKNLPPAMVDILVRKTSDFTLSPDEQMILYSASSSGVLNDNLIRPLPGASTQKQDRNIKIDHTYIYDIKEDRNFLIADKPVTLRWMPSGRHLLMAEPNQITAMDYDGTNRQVIYSGIYSSPFAFPFTNTTKLLILTNLGGDTTTPNLYTLTVK